MKINKVDSLTFDLPPIRFLGRSSVKTLNVTVHAEADESSRLYDYLSEKILEEIDECKD